MILVTELISIRHAIKIKWMHDSVTCELGGQVYTINTH